MDQTEWTVFFIFLNSFRSVCGKILILTLEARAFKWWAYAPLFQWFNLPLRRIFNALIYKRKSVRFQQRMKVLIYVQIGFFWSLIKGHVAAARKRCHQWWPWCHQRWPWSQTILKQFEEWDVIVSCDQLGETFRAAPTRLKSAMQSWAFHLGVGEWNFKISGDEVDDKNYQEDLLHLTFFLWGKHFFRGRGGGVRAGRVTFQGTYNLNGILYHWNWI